MHQLGANATGKQTSLPPHQPAENEDSDLQLIPLVVIFLTILFEGVVSPFCLAYPKEGEIRLEDRTPSQRRSAYPKFRSHIGKYGGGEIYAFLLARLACSLALYALSMRVLFECKDREDNEMCPEWSFTIVFTYSTALALLSVWSATWEPAASRSNTLILLSTFGVYLYRDVWPLATYSPNIPDIEQGLVIWVKISILAITSIGIPLFIPRKYAPVDQDNPSKDSIPELTCSLFSYLTYGYLDPVVILGSRVSHIAHDQFPALSDRDWAYIQRKGAFPYIDRFEGSNRGRHIGWGLLWHFRSQFGLMILSTLVATVFQFLGPFGINRVLRYLEESSSSLPYHSSGQIRPWVWILCLFTGPLFSDLFTHFYLWIMTVTRVRTESIITQLVFEHALRIRAKPGIETQSGSGSDHATPENIEGNQMETIREGENLLGKINNFATSDLASVVAGIDFLNVAFKTPLQIIFCAVFLFQVLGWSSLIGFAVTAFMTPIATLFGKQTQSVQIEKMKRTDARVQAITEAVGVLRMIKLFGWEPRMTKQLGEIREEELQWLWKLKKIKTYSGLFGLVVPSVTMLSTYMTYTAIMKEELTASKIFSSLVVFNILRDLVQRLSFQTPVLIEGKVSLDRINDFIQNTELLDRFEDSSFNIGRAPAFVTNDVDGFRTRAVTCDDCEEPIVGFKDANFSWALDTTDGSLTAASRNFRFSVEGELYFKKGKINLIIGPTGSGKTSLLMALLGEMHFIPAGPDSWYNLPRAEGIAYAAQESWVQNASIKENILFGSAFDEPRYKKVIEQCALQPDLELFDAGDATEVGERGLTLSGGQKARVTLARAIYSSAKILLLDDILAALDVHTSAWIVKNCLLGDLVKERTVLLATHNVALTAPIAGFVVSLRIDGRVHAQGEPRLIDFEGEGVQVHTPKLERPNGSMDLIDTPHDIVTSTNPSAKPSSDGALIIAEEIVHGHVTWKSMELLLSALVGDHAYFFALTWVGGMFCFQVLFACEAFFLSRWGSQYETHPSSEVDLSFYLPVIASITFSWLAVFSATYSSYIYRSIDASRRIHAQLLQSVFTSTLRWLDETPTARMITRFTQDFQVIDGQMIHNLHYMVEELTGIVVKFSVIVWITPLFMIPALLSGLLAFSLGLAYLKAQLSAKREMSNARSPIIAHFSAAIHGLVSIRAYGAQEPFKAEALRRIDYYARPARVSWTLNRWVSLRTDALGALFPAALAVYLVYGRRIGAGTSGVSLNMATSFCLHIFWIIRIFNELEVEANSVERIQSYLDIGHEAGPTDTSIPPSAWPTTGDLRVENLSARYSETGPEVLHNISFHVAAGERIGIVGRTGSGSSLTLALLRCILTEGSVYYDNVLTKTVNLSTLRSNITIIPQTPELLSGTLRLNLDPFGLNDDSSLHDALRSAGLFSLQGEGPTADLTLDTYISGGGNNLSVGQRQIIAIARAMIRGSKLLILDEATSAIDNATDAIIQNALRNQLAKDTTVITIAHRLRTIMDADKIMVLEAGNIVEFDTPASLLRKDGAFKSMVEGDGGKDILHALSGL